MDFLFRLFDPSGFPARWNCGTAWTETPWLGWLHILSDLGVWGAYLAIPLVLMYFLLRRQDLPFRRIFLLFGAFILACGTTHLMEAIIFWWPAYRLAGVIKLLTAIVSWATVLALFRVVPAVLTMRAPEELEREIAARKLAECALQRANAELEQRVQSRTADLTQAVAELQIERELLSTTLGSIGDGVIVTDTDGRVSFLNSKAETLTGWRTTEAKGLPLDEVFQIVDQQTRQPIESPVQRALEGGTITGPANDTLLLARNGTERAVNDCTAPIRGSSGLLRGAVLVIRDITDRKQAEQALKEADHRKDEFLATLAHELRNPLAPVRNSLEVMKRAKGDADLIEQSRSTMERQIAQMVRLIDDLLDVSRISRNKLELRRERVELGSIIQHAVEACRPLVDSANHELNISLPPAPIYLHADFARLAQVFGNLLTNACKYTEPGGRIRLTAERQGDEVTVSIRDTGIGIPSQMLARLFEMFVQFDPTLERTRGGLGIGLALVKRLVEMHDGTVVGTSNGRGLGSEFVVRLPILADVAHPSIDAPSDENAAVIARRILVVDDNLDAALTLSTLLELTGNHVEMAHDGQEALSTAERVRPDIILLDIGLPKMNGYDVCRAVRATPWGKRILIVALTGWGQEDDRRKSQQAGFNGHLVKPVDYGDLVKILSNS